MRVDSELCEPTACSIVQTARVSANIPLCRDHFRLVMNVESFHAARPGQFVHLCPVYHESEGYRVWDSDAHERAAALDDACKVPMLRRAYSIAALRRGGHGVEIDVIYRVVGKGTRWMASLREGDEISLLGPLGNAFSIVAGKPAAWLVAGGVGLPPMLWLAQALREAGKTVVAFYGAQSRDLLALTLDSRVPPDVSARSATLSAEEFSRNATPCVISTDDGTLGYRGHIGAAMMEYHRVNPVPSDELVVYACGPERMMRFVAGYCLDRAIECHLCMERNMACGTGMCQSCVVPMHDDRDPQGWRYRLCCTDGPIFRADQIVWNDLAC